MLSSQTLHLQPSASTPNHSITPNNTTNHNRNRLPTPAPSLSLPSRRLAHILALQKPKVIEFISIRAYHSSALPWTYAPNQYALKINNTLFVLALEIDATEEPVGLKFNFTKFEEAMYDYQVIGVVGTTKLHVEQLIGLGSSVLASFDSYQNVWWNCQAFLNTYLGVITEGNNKPIPVLSSELRKTAFATMFSPSPLVDRKLVEASDWGMGSEMKVQRRRVTA